MGDVIIYFDFVFNNIIYIFYIERDEKDDVFSGVVIEWVMFILFDSGVKLIDRELIWC